ncbi:MAG: type II secretion system protein [Patescibacteria group bacterium]
MRYISTQQGFSLVETLVAITILLLVIIGPMTISTSTAKSTSFASEQAIAYFLAQEGAELAQKARDEAVLNGFNGQVNTWTSFLSTQAGSYFEPCVTTVTNGVQSPVPAASCGLEQLTNAAGSFPGVQAVDCATIANCQLRLNTNPSLRARYTHSNVVGSQPTIYTRQVFLILNTIFPNEVRVRSRVTWYTGSIRTEQSVEVETYLFNIYGN